MSKEALQLYGDIQKFDAGDNDSLIVSGIASTPCQDADGEIIEPDAMRKALGDYLLKGTCREMHQPIAAGRPLSAFVDDEGKTHVTVKIVDKGTIQKIRDKVLKGFSIGAKLVKKIDNRITELVLKDISVVDIPNNPECVFTLVKFDASEGKEQPKEVPITHKEKDMSAELLQKVELLTGTVDKLTKSLTDIAALSKSQGEEIVKMRADAEKLAADARTVVENKERTDLIAKMDSEGRVAINPATGKGCTLEDLQKMDLNALRFASVNSPRIPTEARAIFKSEAKPKAGEGLKGTEKTEAIWVEKYDSLANMQKLAN